jgi:two-component system response regulator PilR (NtrC family)
LSAGAKIDVADLQLGETLATETPSGRSGETLDDYLNRIERQAIQAALEQAGGNRTAAARLLGISFRSLRYRLDRLGLGD